MVEVSKHSQRKLGIRDIAKLSGVSAASVSAVLNGQPKISEATRKRIQEIIDAHHYTPQGAARALSTRKTFQIGFLLSCKVTLGLANSYFATMLSGVHDICRKRGYHVVISTYDLSDINEFIMPMNLRQANIDGVVLAGITDLEVIREIQKVKLPFITIGEKYPNDILCVNNDDKVTSERILAYLYSLGHRRIVIPTYYADTELNYSEAREQLKWNNNWVDLELEFTRYSGNEFDSGAELAEEWFRRNDETRFSALSASDQFCAGFLGRFLGKGGRCPEEVSLIAVESPLSRYGIVQMTTFDDHAFVLGQQAALCLLDLLDNRRTFEEISFGLNMFKNNADIIVRDTTAIYRRPNYK